jgi:ketosteroid isomerase-like protein
MSANEDFVRAGFAAFNRGDRGAWLAFIDPDAQFHPAGFFPDFDTVFQGREGFAAFWDRFHEPWDELRAEVERIEDDGDVVAVDLRYVAERTGAPHVELAMGAAIRVRNGLGVLLVSGSSAEDARDRLKALATTSSGS